MHVSGMLVIKINCLPKCQVPSEMSFVGIHCQTASKKHQYTSAWAAGEQLADDMIVKGADSILEVAKAAAAAGIKEEHEKKLQQKLQEQARILSSGEPVTVKKDQEAK